LAGLEHKAGAVGFWDDPAAAQRVMGRVSQLRESLVPWRALATAVADTGALLELAEEEGAWDENAREITQGISAARHELDRLETAALLSGEHDADNAILDINAGAGGTEACDWVDMLHRMYLRWAEQHGYACRVVDQTAGDVAGSRSITTIVEGPNAYGYLKAERGVHRLVRISPFDANKRRHTSFAAVDAIPELARPEEVVIDPDDLRIDTYRASSAGGQHVQKNETAVRITHLPTGIVVQCQNERSQRQNREVAMRVLASRLQEMKEREKAEKIEELRGERRSIEWGNQIRSYVFQPYTLVKDHRTNYEVGDVQRVMNGDIDGFIRTQLQVQSRAH
jgi:peptide chain release factor 2